MSSTIDNRVVSMGFDNKQFETGVKQSTESLDNLKKSLDLTKAVKGLSDLNAASRGFSLSHMANAIDTINNKLSAFGVVGFTVFQNLTNAAIDFGKKIVSSFLAPAKQGFAEYELQLNAIQTVLANTESKGTTLEDVNKALQELNAYADRTIYNFGEMTKNIGTFTAAGTDLETSVAAIKGIANLAAVSGSNSQQAATAMYQLSQALASGTVKLMDWNSVVNAGMGGQVFQDALKETARVHGVAVDDIIKKQGSFRESLSEGWVTSEILLETLSKFTGDLNKEQLVTMGYTEEQIAGILKLGETANDAATKVKTFSQLKQTLQEALGSGWAQTWQIIIGDFGEAKAFFTDMSNTLGGLIQKSSDSRNAILQDWKDWGGRILLIGAVQNVFEGLLSIAKPITEAFREIFPVNTLQILKDLTFLVWKFAKRLVLSGETADKVKRIFKGIFSVFALAKDIVVAFATTFLGLFKNVKISGAGILEFLAKIGDFLVKVRESVDINKAFEIGIEKIRTFFEKTRVTLDEFLKSLDKFKIIKDIKTWFKGLLENIDLGSFEKFKDSFVNFFKNMDFTAIKDFFGLIKARFGFLDGFIEKISDLVKKLTTYRSQIASSTSGITDKIKGFLSNIGEIFSKGISNIKFDKLFDVVNTGLIAALVLAISKFLKSGGNIFTGITDIFKGFTGIFTSISGILDGVRGSLEVWQQNLKAKTLLTIAIAIGVLALSLVTLSLIDSKKLTIAITAVTGLFIDLVGAMAVLSKVGGLGVKSGFGLVAVAATILLLSFALAKISTIDQGAVKQGIAIIGIALTEIAGFMLIASGGSVSIKSAVGVFGIVAAILLLSLAIGKLGKMDTAQMQQGLLAVGIIFGEIAAFTRLVGSGKGIISTAIGMAVLSASMYILMDVLSKLGNMDMEVLKQGLIGLGAALLIIAVSSRIMPKNMILVGAGLVVVAIALGMMSKSLASMGKMSWEEIARGLVVLGGSLLILSIALYAMSGTIMGSLALLVAAGALMLLTPVLIALGSLPLATIAIALVALAGVFIVLGLAGMILTPVVPTLIGLGIAMMLIGAAAMLVGVGLLAFSIGLAAIAVFGIAAAAAIVAMAKILLPLVPLIIETIIDAIIQFSKGIVKATPEVQKAITAMLLAFLQVIIDTTPKIVETLGVLIDALIQLIVDNIPKFVGAIFDLIQGLLDEIEKHLPEFIESGLNILMEFLKGIRDNIGEIVTVVTEIVTEFLDAVGDNVDEISQAGWDLIIDFINGLSEGIDDNIEAVYTAMGKLAANIIEGVVKGIGAGASKVIAAIVALVTGGKEAAAEEAESESPSKVFMRIGRTFPEGMAAGILRLAYLVENATKNLSKKAIRGISSVSSFINNAFTDNMDMNPTIRPVIDMSEIISGGKFIDTFLDNKSLNLVPSMVTSRSISNNMNGKNIDSNGNIINEGANIKLIQNNFSPKPLSRIEIYRQTNNQLRTLKGLVKT